MSIGFVLGDLLLTMTKRLVVVRRIDRPELPHLTISFQNASGEIDLHLKNENPESTQQQYTPLVRVSKAKVEEFIEGLSPRAEEEFRLLFSKIERVGPNWLTSRKYVIALIHKENFQSAILEATPKLRGKYRVDVGMLKGLFNDADQSMISLLDPSVLNSPELKNFREPIFAARACGRDKLIALIYAPLKGSFHPWIRVDSIGKELPSVFHSLITPEIRNELKDTWHKVHAALQLHELDIARD